SGWFGYRTSDASSATGEMNAPSNSRRPSERTPGRSYSPSSSVIPTPPHITSDDRPIDRRQGPTPSGQHGRDVRRRRLPFPEPDPVRRHPDPPRPGPSGPHRLHPPVPPP